MKTTENRYWNSSLLNYTEYDHEDNRLMVTFNNNVQYVYMNVTNEEYENFCKAESQGTFFGKTFRGKKDYAKVTDGEIGEIVIAKKEEPVNGNQESI